MLKHIMDASRTAKVTKPMRRPIHVELGPISLAIARRAALRRQEENRAANQKDGRVMLDPLKPDIQGAIGEMAAACAFQLPWTGKFKPHAEWITWRTQDGADIGDSIEVRATACSTGSLILHDSDKDNSPYVLVKLVNDDTEAYIYGWLTAKEGRKGRVQEDRGHGRPCYYVGVSHLHRLDILPGLPVGLDMQKLYDNKVVMP